MVHCAQGITVRKILPVKKLPWIRDDYVTASNLHESLHPPYAAKQWTETTIKVIMDSQITGHGSVWQRTRVGFSRVGYSRIMACLVASICKCRAFHKICCFDVLLNPHSKE